MGIEKIGAFEGVEICLFYLILRYARGNGLPEKSSWYIEKMLPLFFHHDGMSGGGLMIAETADAKALYSWLSYWNDLLEFETTPCVEDAEAGEVLSSLKR